MQARRSSSSGSASALPSVHLRSSPTRSVHRQVARFAVALCLLLLLEGWWRSGPSHFEELENAHELEFYPPELLQDVPDIADGERLHLATLHEGCMKHRESVITWEFGRNGDKDGSGGRFQRDDRKLRQKLENCPDVEVFLPSGIRGDGYCEDAMGYVKCRRQLHFYVAVSVSLTSYGCDARSAGPSAASLGAGRGVRRRQDGQDADVS
jgi:hypothetical protein